MRLQWSGNPPLSCRPHGCALALVDSATTREDGGILYSFDYAGDAPATCPECGGTMRAHGRQSLTFADGPRDGAPTFIRVGFQRRRCQTCGCVWRPRFSELESGLGKLTRRAVEFARRQSETGATPGSIAREIGVDRKTVVAVLKPSPLEKEDSA